LRSGTSPKSKTDQPRRSTSIQSTETPAPTEAVDYKAPTYRRLVLPLIYQEPKRPLINREERRRFEQMLVESCRVQIKKHIKEVGKEFGKS
jgi:hypothetical protein